MENEGHTRKQEAFIVMRVEEILMQIYVHVYKRSDFGYLSQKLSNSRQAYFVEIFYNSPVIDNFKN